MAGCLDLDAPIVPGQAAAGISLGSAVETLLDACRDTFIEQHLANTCLQLPTSLVRYSSDPVALWARGGTIEQIEVRWGYRGALPGGIRIGATVAEVEAALGATTYDDDGNLVVARLPGAAFQTGTPKPDASHTGESVVRITACYIFVLNALV
jgi:hypothetical protein